MTDVLVTGGSSGIGLATALRFAARGDRIALLSRSSQALERAATQCRRAGAAAVVVVPGDVSDAEQVERAFGTAIESFGGLDVCVHAAAVAAYGRLEELPGEIFDRVVDVNIKGAANVARTALRHFRARGAGTLILLGSVIGRIATPYMSAYGVSKWAIRGLARTLHVETRGVAGVHVCEVWPGSVNTPVYEQSANVTGRGGRPPPPVLSADRVAAVVLDVADRPRPRAGVGWANPLMMVGFSVLPGVFDRLVGPLMARLGLSGTSRPETTGNVVTPRPEAERVTGPWRGPLGLRRSGPDGD